MNFKIHQFDLLVRRLRDEAMDILVGQRDRLFQSLHFLNQDLRSGKFACRIKAACDFFAFLFFRPFPLALPVSRRDREPFD